MVRVTPVSENEKKYEDGAAAAAAGAGAEDEYYDTDSEVSDASDDEDEDLGDETISDRLVALKDIVPPQYRSKCVSTFSQAYNWASSGLTYGGKFLWVVTTSGLLLAVPLALSIVSEQQLMEMEKEMKLNPSADVLGQGQQQAVSQEEEKK